MTDWVVKRRLSTEENRIKSRHLTPEAHVDIGLLPLEYEALRHLIPIMSSKPMARQRIIPAIPHQLSIRRAKVVPAGKNDQQLADDKGKSASLLANADKPDVPTSTDGIEDINAHQGDENTVSLNGSKDEQAKQVPVKEEPVATKELAVNKEPLEKEKAVENKEELPAEKEVVVEKKTKEVNGKLYLPRVSYKMLSHK